MKRLFTLSVFLLLITVAFSENYVAGIFSDDNIQVQIESSSPGETKEFTLKIKNIGFQTVSLLWDECSISGKNSEITKMLLSEYVYYTDSQQMETIIEPYGEISVKIVPFNMVANGSIETYPLSEKTISMFFVYNYETERRSLPLRVKFPFVKEQSTFDKVFPWVMAGAGTVLVLGIIFWPHEK
ncbi:MAG TPA: hypothetical protein PK466_01295 [Thermotogota bacterium]|nr:hypothetical protein [Thermotogota bacterium]HPJ87625.1 hypothetical protein [Thermotogota bacterium]HPR94937.1 hypothetical protein [Thermotogota bacterium]